jgi:hypothetical protein
VFFERKWDIMSYNAKADENYRKKCKTIGLKFTLNELDFYENIVKHCENNNLSLQGYIKNLIRKDLDK